MHASETADFHHTQAVARFSLPSRISRDTQHGHEGSRQPLCQVQPWNESGCQRVSDKWGPQPAKVRFQHDRVGKDERRSVAPPPVFEQAPPPVLTPYRNGFKNTWKFKV